MSLSQYDEANNAALNADMEHARLLLHQLRDQWTELHSRMQRLQSRYGECPQDFCDLVADAQRTMFEQLLEVDPDYMRILEMQDEAQRVDDAWQIRQYEAAHIMAGHDVYFWDHC